MVHIGLGAFHRAHQAVYNEKLITAGDRRWGILGVSLRDPVPAAILAAQDHLFSVTQRHGEMAKTQVIGSLYGALHSPSALEQVLQAIANPQVHIVSTTVTEKGYCQSPATTDLDFNDPGIIHDLAFPDAPVTVLGVLSAGIRKRPANAPLTLLCCDNMAGNGDKLRKLLVQFAKQTDTDLANRIEHDIGIPNSMVDRIVPAATPESLQWASSLVGLRDEAAIVCEPFTQWVIEDRFAGTRPAWEDVGVVLTSDVRPYQEMKLRLLNGTHSAIAYAGQLCGLETVADVMKDPEVGVFVRQLMRNDLRTSVTCPPGYDIDSYCDDLLDRFTNRSLGHRTEQIAMDGTQKVPVRWLPAIRESLQSGKPLSALERSLAIWLFYLDRQRNDGGHALRINDVGATDLVARLHSATTTRDLVHAALGYTKVFGHAEWPSSFVERLIGHFNILREKGIYALINA
ncbi:polyol:NADP oxidoreductase [mine drainage metagenome]|uniref:Polyol:NADP oxidoreductase n=1 Tax=mine drainage metagenome TaxID=410659 RepID=A0A1J5PXT0_9ZZZZ